jgi:uncharacterized protein YbbC (DUF1343 family)
MLLGVDVLVKNRFRQITGADVALCTNYPAGASNLLPTLEIFKKQKKFRLRSIFTPEHGLYAALQDQVKTPDRPDPKTPVLSLYGRRREPDPKILKSIDTIVIDLIDIGVRYYTFLWTAVLVIRQAARFGVKVLILDRPNPLGGRDVQGPVLEPSYSSFVGLYPIPVRHGMTIGELVGLLNGEFGIGGLIEVVKMEGWKRSAYYHETGLVWPIPSPNMPGPNTAYVYPGMCLLEGTNISEGRGTTRPFELFGAPWINPGELAVDLNREKTPGVRFRPVYFQPTFNKYRGQLCGGIQLVTHNLPALDPFRLGLWLIKKLLQLYPRQFQWRRPPYEGERVKMPFDILVGNSWIRNALERNRPLAEVERRWRKGLEEFINVRKKYLLY